MLKEIISSFREKNRVSFFDNIFYWIWTTVPSKGFPDRSFVVVTVCQFSYVLLFVSILSVSYTHLTLPTNSRV